MTAAAEMIARGVLVNVVDCSDEVSRAIKFTFGQIPLGKI